MIYSRTIRTPGPCRLPQRQIERHAERIAAILRTTANSSPAEIVQDIGGELSIEDPNETTHDDADGIVAVSNRCFRISVGRGEEPRQRVEAAHEIAHLFLHYPAIAREAGRAAVMVARKKPDADDEAGSQADREANWFAYAFLMPAAAFEEAWRRHGGDAARAARHFNVTAIAALRRRRTLEDDPSGDPRSETP